MTRSEQAQIVEYVAAVEAAQRHGSQWQVRRALGGDADAQTTLASADEVIAHLHRGLQALDSANALNFEPPQGYEAIKAQLNREAHRRLGAKWEQMANALGSVHRGKIDAALLGELRGLARTTRGGH